MDTPASKNFTLKLGTGFQHAKATNSTWSRPLRQHADHSAVGFGRSRADTEMGLNELCAGLIDTVWDQSARIEK
ncbi:hypothetical protein AYI70_g6309 [Smittium culicis]|uniref:Uncharacterized protein n=1 Tax=Smittium culicis TaxID=133412 RepID=A0A1R1XQI1_9FUNG|nr:hypothetical protein AYI70_g6309 [Smittium culicis]